MVSAPLAETAVNWLNVRSVQKRGAHYVELPWATGRTSLAVHLVRVAKFNTSFACSMDVPAQRILNTDRGEPSHREAVVVRTLPEYFGVSS